MAWSKAYSNWIQWVNRPSTNSPIDQVALNKISNGLDTVDDRVITLDSTKANQSDFLTAVKSITLNSTTGVLTITYFNDTTTTIDTLLEKVAVNFDFDDDPTSAHYQQLIIELDDGTYKYVDLSALITEFEFVDTSTIGFTVENDGTIKAVVKAGSITGTHLDPDYLAQINTQVAAAAGSARDAASSATDAHADAQLAQSYSIGTNGVIRQGDATDNAKYYKEQAQSIVNNFTIENETPTFTEASTRANIASGETVAVILGKIKKFFSDLKIVAFTGSYDDLVNKPEHLGHSIKDATSTYTDRSALKIIGSATVTDDSTNDQTIIEMLGVVDRVYQTKAAAEADINNIEEGELVWTLEDSASIVTRVQNLETNVANLDTDLGDKSSASSVSGADAFTKINTLNSKLTDVTVVDSDTVNDDYVGTITFKKYSNGMKHIHFSNNSMSASAQALSATIPSGYRPLTVASVIATTWSSDLPRPLTLQTDGSMSLKAASEVGVSCNCLYC